MCIHPPRGRYDVTALRASKLNTGICGTLELTALLLRWSPCCVAAGLDTFNRLVDSEWRGVSVGGARGGTWLDSASRGGDSRGEECVRWEDLRSDSVSGLTLTSVLFSIGESRSSIRLTDSLLRDEVRFQHTVRR